MTTKSSGNSTARWIIATLILALFAFLGPKIAVVVIGLIYWLACVIVGYAVVKYFDSWQAALWSAGSTLVLELLLLRAGLFKAMMDLAETSGEWFQALSILALVTIVGTLFFNAISAKNVADGPA